VGGQVRTKIRKVLHTLNVGFTEDGRSVNGRRWSVGAVVVHGRSRIQFADWSSAIEHAEYVCWFNDEVNMLV